jgi:ABC-2 type transporter
MCLCDQFRANPLFILSGFSFPMSGMPDVLQWFTYTNPLRYYLIVIRGTFLEGSASASCGRICRRWRLLPQSCWPCVSSGSGNRWNGSGAGLGPGRHRGSIPVN